MNTMNKVIRRIYSGELVVSYLLCDHGGFNG